MARSTPDAWTVYCQTVQAARSELGSIRAAARAAFEDATVDARAVHDAVVGPAEAVFAGKRAAAWAEYRERVAAEDGTG